jgi:hypothetical protein
LNDFASFGYSFEQAVFRVLTLIWDLKTKKVRGGSRTNFKILCFVHSKAVRTLGRAELHLD